jgi:PadR family transcriptional regulator AphA
MKSKPIRLTTTSYAVFSLIDMLGEATPYDLKRTLERSIENFWHIPHTTFYAEPRRLASAGYLSEHQEAGGRRRKLYALTEQGREALQAWTRSTDVGPPQLHDEGVLKVFAGADPRPIFTQQRDWHLAKLAELQSCLEEVRAATTAPSGAERSLLAGLGYHSALLEQIERFLAEGSDLSADGPDAYPAAVRPPRAARSDA